MKKMRTLDFLELKIPPPVISVLFAGMMWGLSVAVPSAGFALPAPEFVALMLAVLGGVLAAAGIVAVLRAKTTITPHHPDKSSSLVTTGAYAVTRNPMYLGLLLTLIGWAVYLSNLTSFAVFPLFVVYLNRFQITPEEKMLSSLFGSEYEAYRRRVGRWL